MSRHRDLALAVTSGVLLALSFPKFGHPAIAWIALAPLLIALSESLTLMRAFVLGVAAGLIYFTGTLYWLAFVMIVYGNLSAWIAVPLALAFIAYLALFPAVFASAMWRLVAVHGARALVAAPLVWVTTELGRTYIMTGFPWVLVGYSQARVLPVAQFASLFGVYGVSALVVSVNAAVAIAAIGARREGSSPAWRPAIAGPLSILLLVVLVTIWGSLRVRRSEWTSDGESIRVGLVQGNVEQAQKYDPARAAAIFQNYLQLTRQAIGDGAQLVLWPEASAPFVFDENRADTDLVRALARASRVPILVGSDEIERSGSATGSFKAYNSAFLVGPDGETAGVYRKMHLVPWGEYVPWRRLLFFVEPLVETIGEFAKGDRPVVLPVGGHSISTAICYEIVYPALVRQFVSGGSELLTTITNDAWFGATSAPYQHFEQASMRAIEEGRYLVRSANTGISGIVDPYGRVLAESGIYQPAVVVGEARFLRVATIYARTGDVFAFACGVMTLALFLFARRQAD